MEIMKTNIYVLKCPTTLEVRYVGKTNNDKQRYKAHLNKARDINTHKRNWINKLRLEGKKPIFKIIEEIDIVNWQIREKYWIEYYIAKGCKLTNYIKATGNGLSHGNQTSYNGKNARKVVAIDKTGTYFNTFDSISLATEFIGKIGIPKVLSGENKTCGNYIWLYEEDYYKLTDKELQYIVTNAITNKPVGGKTTQFKKGNKTWNTGKHIKTKPDKNVHQYSALTGEFIKTWGTAKQASLKLNCNMEGIGQCARGNAKSAGGYIWSYILQENVPIIKYKGKTNNMIKTKLK